MKWCLAMALFVGAGAFSATPTPLSQPGLTGASLAVGGTAPGSLRRAPQPTGESIASFGAIAAATAIAAVGLSLRRRTHKSRTARHYAVGLKESQEKTDLMSGEIYQGDGDSQTPGQRNYVNPWEERVDYEEFDELSPDLSSHFAKPPTLSEWNHGETYYNYTGPVYKQVPVAEGVSFPLDPKIWDEKKGLEPPKPGAKWGDGRDPEDGNWYMNVEEDGVTKKVQYYTALGNRKTGFAIVRLFEGTGQFIINGQEAMDYFFDNPKFWMKAVEPICMLNEKNNYDITCKVFGGGKSGQSGAIRLALARCLQELNYNWRPLLKKARYLTWDWRKKEPKKPGLIHARKKTPYNKR
jgi:small subunit ribosomal protein S9